MLTLSYIYIYFYFHYSYYGYNCINRYLNRKKIDTAILDYRGYSFIGKRLCMLSNLVLLYSVYFLENPNIKRYGNVILLHSVVNIGYYVNWGVYEVSTFLFHIFWAFPVIVYGLQLIELEKNNLYTIKLDYENLFIICGLLFYVNIYNYIYTPRIEFIDNPY